MSEGLGIGRKNLVEEIIKSNWKVSKPELKNFSYNELLFVIQEMLDEEGKAYHGKRTGRRGHHIFKNIMQLLLTRNLANYDSMVLLTGNKGAGKSSAAIMMAREWMNLQGRRFDPKRHIAYTNADIMNKIETLDKFEVLICDEAVRFCSSEDWNKAESKALKKKLAEVRTKHLLFILCFPLKIQKVDKTYLEAFTNYWVDVISRGVGACYIKDMNPSKDAWRIKDFDKVGSYNEFTTTSKLSGSLKKHPNFWQLIKFPKVPKHIYDRYLEVREKNVYDDDVVFDSVTGDDINNALLVLALRDIMMQDGSLSMNRISLHIKNEYDINITKNDVLAAVDDAKQLVAKVRERAIKA